ncbi:hypothetical protein [Streptomyces sp. NBRC 109706]|uniref:hypothetical protein n=1 Tax=Streptomyces sp. NBRC 109706 TaxID=1550035 RepID=UPI00351C4CBB
MRSSAEGRIDFVHRTFQEYLAAEEAAEQDRIGSLVGRAHLDLWRETIIMTAGHANAPQRTELLDGILNRADAEPRHARTLRLLAAACQETLPEIPDGLADRLEEAVTRLLPARRRTDPPALAAVGASLLRQLPSSLGQLSEKAAIQTVRTVALIGGEESLKVLADWVGDEREGVVGALIAAWNYFDADLYADEVLSQLPLEGYEVRLTHSGQLRVASRLHGLTNVFITCPVRNLDFLADFPPLRYLWVSQLDGEANLSVLCSHPQLETLGLFGLGSVQGTAVLSDLPQLKQLALPLEGDLAPQALPLLSELTFLSMCGGSMETDDLGVLTAMPKLRHVDLTGDGTGTPPGFEELADMTGLTSLWLRDYDVDTWLSSLRSVPPALSELHCYYSVVPADPDAFARLGSLEYVLLFHCHTPDGTPVTSYDIPGAHTRVIT